MVSTVGCDTLCMYQNHLQDMILVANVYVLYSLPAIEA